MTSSFGTRELNFMPRLLDRILTRQIHLTCTRMAESWWITDSSSTSWWIFFTGWVWRWILMPFSHLSRIDYKYTIFINKMSLDGYLSGDVRSWLYFSSKEGQKRIRNRAFTEKKTRFIGKKYKTKWRWKLSHWYLCTLQYHFSTMLRKGDRRRSWNLA